MRMYTDRGREASFFPVISNLIQIRKMVIFLKVGVIIGVAAHKLLHRLQGTVLDAQASVQRSGGREHQRDSHFE